MTILILTSPSPIKDPWTWGVSKILSQKTGGQQEKEHGVVHVQGEHCQRVRVIESECNLDYLNYLWLSYSNFSQIC